VDALCGLIDILLVGLSRIVVGDLGYALGLGMRAATTLITVARKLV
jgi:hypothetical protein